MGFLQLEDFKKVYNGFYARIDNRKYNTWCKYTSRIDTYGCGCAYNCEYCYSRHLLSFRKNWNPSKPKKALITEIEKRISILPKNEVVKLGGMTDCFQPIELKECVTYETIKLLNRYRINYLIVTKSNMVSHDKYIKIYDKELAHFQITITSTGINKYENAPNVKFRIESIEKLYKMGFDVSIRLSPFIIENIDYKILNKIKCEKILIEFLKVNHFVKKTFKIDYSKYTLKYGGYTHLGLREKIKHIKKINNFKQKTIGEYVKSHYKYFRDNYNYNKEDCCNISITNREYYNIVKQTTLFS